MSRLTRGLVAFVVLWSVVTRWMNLGLCVFAGRFFLRSTMSICLCVVWAFGGLFSMLMRLSLGCCNLATMVMAADPFVLPGFSRVAIVFFGMARPRLLRVCVVLN